MTTIQKTLSVPPSHRITLDVPPDIPAGATASVVVTFAPPAGEANAQALLSLAGAFANSKTFAGDSVALVRSVRDEW